MRVWPLLVGGGALAYWWTRSSHSATAGTPSFVEPLSGRWLWPVPRWNGRTPVISDGFGSLRAGGVRHGGVDVMFERLSSDTFQPGTPNGAAHHVMPDGIVAIAASDGVVWSAMQTPRGFAVVIDHAPMKVATFYQHLERLLVKPTANASTGERVRAGQPIGVIGSDPLDAEHLKHLHFEIWLGGPSNAIDPAPLMRTWETGADPSALVARNASLVYRAIGDVGEPYPAWLRALAGKAGVYVIRDLDAHETLYVGSSSSSLYDTVTRHFQTWRRLKSFWKGQYGQGHDPGVTYDRGSVEVAVRITSSSRALDVEMQLIARLRPRDNIVGQPADKEPAPF